MHYRFKDRRHMKTSFREFDLLNLHILDHPINIGLRYCLMYSFIIYFKNLVL